MGQAGAFRWVFTVLFLVSFGSARSRDAESADRLPGRERGSSGARGSPSPLPTSLCLAWGFLPHLCHPWPPFSFFPPFSFSAPSCVPLSLTQEPLSSPATIHPFQVLFIKRKRCFRFPGPPLTPVLLSYNRRTPRWQFRRAAQSHACYTRAVRKHPATSDGRSGRPRPGPPGQPSRAAT